MIFFACAAFSGIELRMSADVDEQYLVAFFLKQRPIISGNVDAPTIRIRTFDRMIIEKWMKWLAFKKILAFYKLQTGLFRQLLEFFNKLTVKLNLHALYYRDRK